jgi:predicted dehydrogenase
MKLFNRFIKSENMTKTINVGIISSGFGNEVFVAAESYSLEKFFLKKIFVADQAATDIAKAYPEAEIVSDVKSIVNDEAIELVIVSASGVKNSPAVEEALQAGKHVRII